MIFLRFYLGSIFILDSCEILQKTRINIIEIITTKTENFESVLFIT